MTAAAEREREPELQPCTRFDWERILRRCRIPLATKAVGFVLAQYGDVHGRHIRPGTDRLAAICDMGERTVRRHLQALRDLGLIVRVRGGGGCGGVRQQAAEWRLSVPADLLARVDMLDPDEGSAANTVAGVRRVGGPESPVDSPRTPAVQVAAVVEGPGREHRPPGTEHRPSGDRSAATQVAAHQETTQGTPKTSPQVSTSPVDPQPRRSRHPPPTDTHGPPPPGWRDHRPPPEATPEAS